MNNFFNDRVIRLSKRMALIVVLSVGFLACQSKPDLPDDISTGENNLGADESFAGNLDYETRPLDFWDTIVEPVNGDNRLHLREIFDDENNHKIFIKKGTYPIDVLSKDSDNRSDRYNLMIKDRQNVLIYFEEGAKIKVNPNDVGGHSTKYSVIGIANSKDVSVINPTIEGDKYTHLGSGGEWAHGIRVVFKSSNIHIKGADIRKMWGDGIDISQGIADETVWPEDVLIEDFKTIDNGRNGISVTCGKDITIKNGETSKNDRTFPKAGIDLERQGAYAPMDNFVIDNVKFRENKIGLISKSGTGAALFKNLDVENGFRIRGNSDTQIVKNSTFTRGDDNPGTRIDIYKPNSPVKFINNTVTGIRLLVQRASDNIEIKNNQFIRNADEHLPCIAISTNNDSYSNTGDVLIKNNLLYQSNQSSAKLTSGIFVNYITGKVQIINNDVNLIEARSGIYIGRKARDVEVNGNTVALEDSDGARVKLRGEEGASYDFSGNTPDISQYSTESLESPLEVNID